MLTTAKKATCHTFLCALAFVSVADAQVVEKGRTFDDLTASHPCASGLENRIARVTDCDAADDIGNGGGAFQCWAICDGSAPWANLAIGGGSGGIGGSTGATDDKLLCSDGTGGYTLGVCTVGDLDNLRFDGNTISSTDTNGNINLAPNGTGSVELPVGALATLAASFAGDSNTGFYRPAADTFRIVAGGSVAATFGAGTLGGSGTAFLDAYKSVVLPTVTGVGSPTVLTSSATQRTYTNEGATAEVYITLPSAAAGYVIEFVVQDSDGIRATAATGDTIRSVASVTGSGGYVASTTIGSTITLKAINATEWVAISITGTWSFN